MPTLRVDCGLTYSGHSAEILHTVYTRSPAARKDHEKDQDSNTRSPPAWLVLAPPLLRLDHLAVGLPFARHERCLALFAPCRRPWPRLRSGHRGGTHRSVARGGASVCRQPPNACSAWRCAWRVEAVTRAWDQAVAERLGGRGWHARGTDAGTPASGRARKALERRAGQLDRRLWHARGTEESGSAREALEMHWRGAPGSSTGDCGMPGEPTRGRGYRVGIGASTRGDSPHESSIRGVPTEGDSPHEAPSMGGALLEHQGGAHL